MSDGGLGGSHQKLLQALSAGQVSGAPAKSK
jgi:hypothetical protein